MVADILFGEEVAKKYLQEVQAYLQQTGSKPVLAIIVGQQARPDAKSFTKYVANRCKKAGIENVLHEANEYNVADKLHQLNQNPEITGIIISHPFSMETGPQSIDCRVMGMINPLKDVEALHPVWSGLLDQYQERLDYQPRENEEYPKCIVPCTPKAIVYMMDHFGLPIFDTDTNKGRVVTTINYSLIIGQPLFKMVRNRKGSCNVCDINTRQDEIDNNVARADIIVAAAGKPGLIHGDQIREGAAVFDLGWNEFPDGTRVGDIDFDSVYEKASSIVPFEGGVGPVTTTMVALNLTYLHRMHAYFRGNGRDDVLLPYAKAINLV